MVKLIDRYIARQVVYASLLILFLLASLRSMFGLLDELGSLNDGGYQMSDALLYVGLMFPTRLLDFFPMSVLIGALFGLGSMAANSELTVLRAAGMTTWQIAASTIKASLILVVMVVIIGEWIAPISVKSAIQLRTAAISGGELSLSKTGLWAKREQEIIQLGNVLSDGQLRDITIYKVSRDNQLDSIIKAKSALKEGKHWILQQVSESQFATDGIINSSQPTRVWLNPLEQSQIETLILEPETLNLIGLIDYLNYLEQNNLDSKVFQLAFWRKLMQPLAIAVMMFLAVSFVFGPMRQVSMGARILSGVLLGFVFHLANQSFGPVSLVFNVFPIIGATMPLVLFALLAYWLMKKVH